MSLASIASALREDEEITIRVKAETKYGGDDNGLLFAIVGRGDPDDIGRELHEYRVAYPPL